VAVVLVEPIARGGGRPSRRAQGGFHRPGRGPEGEGREKEQEAGRIATRARIVEGRMGLKESHEGGSDRRRPGHRTGPS